MTRHAILVVRTNPASAEQEAEFNRWYDKVHLPEIRAKVPAVISAVRYRLSPDGPKADHRYLAIYQIEAENPADVVGEIGRLSAGGSLTMTAALDASSTSMQLYEPLSA